MIGTTLGRYKILDMRGEGGMGRIYVAEDPLLGRRLAVKLLPPEFTNDRDRRERLLHEARAASALNHPNIVIIHDVGEQDGALYVAMELVEGCTLREWGAAAPRSAGAVLRLIRQAATALGVAHAAGLVHRDLKPENIMVRSDGLLKILDFGLARSVSPGAAARTATIPGTVMGTAPYMSPEQVLGQPAGPSSDLFSLGTILYELLTGKHPFAAATTIETMHRILHESPEPPSRVARGLSADFDFVLAKALTKDPKRRHASAQDFDVDLETLECGCGDAESQDDADASGGPRAIAVLPFKNIGGDPELDYLGIGLADAVITRLSYSPDLVVRATGAIAAYQNQPVDPRRVGQELDVKAVLDASFQRIGGRMRATARLVETPGGRALWAGKVDVRFEDVFEVQDQVAQGIADALTARLTVGDVPAKREHVPSPEAFAEVLKGIQALSDGTHERFDDAMRAFERAVLIDPEYARAWAHLGAIYHGMVDSGFHSDPAWFAKADQALARARSLDPEDGQYRYAAGAMHLVRGQKREAYAEFMKARERMPNYALLYHYFSYLYRLCDMLDEAEQMELRGFSLERHVVWVYSGIVRIAVLKGDFAAARHWLDRVRERFGEHHPISTLYEAVILSRQGRWEEVLRVYEGEAAALRVESSHFEIALSYFKLGRNAEGEAAMAVLEPFSRIDMDSAARMGALWAQRGEPDKAFDCLERAVALGNDSLREYSREDFFGPLHGDPRWAPFLDGVKRRVAEYPTLFPLPSA